MNYVLLFVIIALGMGGYYEYSNLTQQIKQDEQTISDQSAKITELQADTDKLQRTNDDLTAKLKAVPPSPQPVQAALAPSAPPASWSASNTATAAAPAATATTAPAAAAPANTPPAAGLDASHLAQGIVIIKGDNAEGTGFLVKTADGPAIITNQHVLANNPHLHFQTTGGAELTPTGMKGATDRDLVMLTIADGPYTYLPLATNLASTTQSNDPVLTPGNSQGGNVALSTQGQMLGIGPDRVEFNNPIYHGNSGGPVFHTKSGTVIAVVTEASNVDLSNDLDKTSFSSRNSAITSSVRYFGMRVDTVPKWEPMDLRQFENETTFLDNFDAQSQRLDSFLNSKGGTDADAKLYETDDHIMTAARAFHDQLSGSDTSQQLDALRQLGFALGSVADRDVQSLQNMGNFYSFDQQRARRELSYRTALKSEIQDFTSNVNRISDLPRSNN